VAAPVGEGPRPVFRVGLDQKAAQVGDGPVNFSRAPLPPLLHRGLQGIGGIQAEFQGTGEVDAQIEADTVFPEDGAEGLGHLQFGGDELRFFFVHVHVVHRNAVDPHGGQQPGIVPHPLQIVHQLVVPEEDGPAGIAPLHTAVQVIPVVDQPQACAGPIHQIQPRRDLPELQEAQKGKGAVEQPPLPRAGDHCPQLTLLFPHLKAEALWIAQVPLFFAAHHNGRFLPYQKLRCLPQKALQTPGQLGDYGAPQTSGPPNGHGFELP